jgi:Di-N-acetylchitobiase
VYCLVLEYWTLLDLIAHQKIERKDREGKKMRTLASALLAATVTIGVLDSVSAFLEDSPFEIEQLRACPCATRSLCLPVVFTTRTTPGKKEVFAFSVSTDDRWKQYDWDRVTTIAWNVDKELLCHAHSKGVKVVVKHNYDETQTLCDAASRRKWIQLTYESIVTNHADGVNIDTEKPLMGELAACQTQLVKELRTELKRHPLTAKAQITFDVPWAPRPIDGRFYEWKQLSEVVDFFFVMSVRSSSWA